MAQILDAREHKPASIITTVRDPYSHDWAMSELRGLTAKKFYGKVILIMEDGKITRGEIHKSIKP